MLSPFNHPCQIRAVYVGPGGSSRFTPVTIDSQERVHLTTPLYGWNGSGPVARQIGDGSSTVLLAHINTGLEHAALTTSSPLNDWNTQGLFMRYARRSSRLVNARASDITCAQQWIIR